LSLKDAFVNSLISSLSLRLEFLLFLGTVIWRFFGRNGVYLLGPMVFDSYQKEDGTRISEYGRYGRL